MAQKEHEQIFPQPGWVEHDANEIWRRTREVIAEALEQRGLRPSDLAAIGITNQRETTVVWDRTDRRARLQRPGLAGHAHRRGRWRNWPRDGGGDRFRAKTGLPLATYFSALKIRWILDNVAGARARAEAGDLLFGNIDTFLLWNLTGGLHLTDCTNASRTQLMNLETLDWDDELLDAFGIPRADAAAHRVQQRSLRRGDAGLREGRARGRHPGRPAGRAGGPDVLPAGRGQEHLRHRMFPADEYRDQAGALAARAC